MNQAEFEALHEGTMHQQKLLEDACLTHGLEFYRGMLLARAQSDNDLATS